MASFRVLFFVFSAILWGQACSAPVPMPAHTPVPGEIVRIQPSQTTGPRIGGGAENHHYYIALGPHPTDPNRHMVAGITHHGDVGLLGPSEPIHGSAAAAHGLTGHVLLTPTSAHVNDISRTKPHQHQGVVNQEWIDRYHHFQRQSDRVHSERARASKMHDTAANAHSEAHQFHKQVSEHPGTLASHRQEHLNQAAHHLSEVERHRREAHDLRQGVIRPGYNTNQHIGHARVSHDAASASRSEADHSRSHGEAAMRHLQAAGVHRSIRDHHLAAASHPNTPPNHVAQHNSQAVGAEKHMNSHIQLAAAHAPHHQDRPDPTHSLKQAEASRVKAAQMLHVLKKPHKNGH